MLVSTRVKLACCLNCDGESVSKPAFEIQPVESTRPKSTSERSACAKVGNNVKTGLIYRQARNVRITRTVIDDYLSLLVDRCNCTLQKWTQTANLLIAVQESSGLGRSGWKLAQVHSISPPLRITPVWSNNRALTNEKQHVLRTSRMKKAEEELEPTVVHSLVSPSALKHICTCEARMIQCERHSPFKPNNNDDTHSTAYYLQILLLQQWQASLSARVVDKK